MSDRQLRVKVALKSPSRCSHVVLFLNNLHWYVLCVLRACVYLISVILKRKIRAWQTWPPHGALQWSLFLHTRVFFLWSVSAKNLSQQIKETRKLHFSIWLLLTLLHSQTALHTKRTVPCANVRTCSHQHVASPRHLADCFIHVPFDLYVLWLSSFLPAPPASSHPGDLQWRPWRDPDTYIQVWRHQCSGKDTHTRCCKVPPPKVCFVCQDRRFIHNFVFSLPVLVSEEKESRRSGVSEALCTNHPVCVWMQSTHAAVCLLRGWSHGHVLVNERNNGGHWSLAHHLCHSSYWRVATGSPQDSE